jgi:hypothetical protein
MEAAMKSEIFINEVRKMYKNARETKYPSKNKIVIKRGTNHTISSHAEDLFAKYCSEKLPNKGTYQILIDPQITFPTSGLRNKSGKRPLLIRPDICILNNGVAKIFFDIKMDIGRKRTEFISLIKESACLKERIRAKYAKASDGQTKKPISFRIDYKLESCFVVISNGNINKESLKKIHEELRDIRGVKAYFLSSGAHPNEYVDDKTYNKKKRLSRESFSAIDSMLKLA